MKNKKLYLSSEYNIKYRNLRRMVLPNFPNVFLCISLSLYVQYTKEHDVTISVFHLRRKRSHIARTHILIFHLKFHILFLLLSLLLLLLLFEQYLHNTNFVYFFFLYFAPFTTFVLSCSVLFYKIITQRPNPKAIR